MTKISQKIALSGIQKKVLILFVPISDWQVLMFNL